MALWTLAKPQQAMVDVNWNSAGGQTIAPETQTASATPHTKGAWNEWVASTSAEWAGFNLLLSGSTSTSATDTSMLLDVGVGSAGNEVPILENLPVGYQTSYAGYLYVPLRVPSGVRVSARIQATVISDTAALKVAPWSLGRGFTGAAASYDTAVTYGADTSTSRGVTVTADTGTTSTFGTWTEIAATTSAPIRAMIVGAQANGDTEIDGSYRLEVGFGGSGNEKMVAALASSASTSEYLNSAAQVQHPPAFFPLTVGIPEGGRLVARLSTSTSTTFLPSLDVVIIGLR